MKHSMNNRGITYIELVLVISISTIILGFSSITIGTAYRNNVGRSGDKLYSIVNQTRNNAMTNGTKRGWITFIYHDKSVYYRIGEKVPYHSGGDYFESYKDWNKLCTDPVKFKYGIYSLQADKPVELSFDQATGDCNGVYEPEADAFATTHPVISDWVILSLEKGNRYSSSMKVYEIGGKVERQ